MLEVPLFELQQILWPLYHVVDLIVGGVLDDDTVVQIQVVVEAKHVHSAVVDEAGVVGFVVKLLQVAVLKVKGHVLLVNEAAAGVLASMALQRPASQALAIVD